MVDLGDPKSVQWAPDIPQVQAQPPPSANKMPQGSIGACDACRARKVRCLANESSMSSKCQRCARAGRECVYTAHSKTRRRKRTDTRVKELEEKVKSLSILLEQGKGENRSVPRRGSGQSPDVEDDGMGDDDDEWSDEGEEAEPREDTTPTIPSRKNFDGHDAFTASKLAPPVDYETQKPRTQDPQDAKHVPTGSISPDVVERGLITLEQAQEVFDRYMNVIAPHFPAMYFAPGTSAAVMRKQRPVLFLAIIAAGAGNQEPSLNLILNQEILQVYANKVAIHGEKSLELVMSILISTLWYYPPDKFEELKFHQYIHMAATMALDIGLGKRPRVSQETEQTPRTALIPELKNSDITQRNVSFSSRSYPDSGGIESRRTLLACYLSCSSVSMSLRLPNMLRFTSWMDDCLNFLETSPEAAPNDKRFVAWIRIQRLVEEVAMTFSLDDPGNTASLCDTRVQQMLKGFEKQLDDLMKSMKAAPGVLDGLLEINFHINNIYIHEIALHPEHDSEDFKPPFYVSATNPKVRTALGPAYVHAITECVTSAQTAIRVFIDMHVDTIRALPALIYVRIIYCSIVLIKLDVSASSPDSEIGKIVHRDILLTRAYIEKVFIQMKRVAGNDNRNLLAVKFCLILGKLVLWYRQFTQPGAIPELQPPLTPAKNFGAPDKPNESSLNATDPSQPVIGLTLPDSTANNITPAPPAMPYADGGFLRFSPFPNAPQYPTPSYTPAPPTPSTMPTTLPTGPDLLPHFSAPPNNNNNDNNNNHHHHHNNNNEGTPQSTTDYSSPELMDHFGGQHQYAIPMDVDPSMFNQLQGVNPFTTYNQDPNEWLLEGMDYSGAANVPDFDWDSIPGPQ